MANFIDKIRVKTASKGHSRLSFSDMHITTSDFFQTCPIFSRENIPGEKMDFNMRSFARLDALVVPTYGRVDMHNRAFFVPFRAIWKPFEAFITRSSYFSTKPVIVPQLSNNDLVGLIYYPIYDSPIDSGEYGESVQSTDVYDLTIDTLGSFDYVKLGSLGRYIYKVLTSLGYNIQWRYDARLLGINSVGDTISYSALPLLAYFKCLFDWYYPSQYVEDSDYAHFNNLLHDFENWVDINVTTGIYNYYGNIVSTVQKLFKLTYFLTYNQDYFTSAFDNPEGPVASGTTPFTMIVNDHLNASEQNGSRINVGAGDVNASNTPVLTSSNWGLSQLGMKTLSALSQFMQRHQLAGARIIDRYVARFGVQLLNQKINRALYLGKYEVPLMVQDIMSTANTVNGESGSMLGDYAGKGLLVDNGNGHFTCSSDEYGIFIVISSIVPRVGYVQGLHRNLMRKTSFDFFTPELDALGTEPVAKAEVYQPSHDADFYAGADSSNMIFGYLPRYASYKMSRDMLTGDFRLASKSVGLTSPAWHLNRLFDNAAFGGDPNSVVHSKEFITCGDKDQYNRLFQSLDNTADHFVVQHLFEYNVSAPCKAAFDIYDFSGEQGHDVTINGNTLN